MQPAWVIIVTVLRRAEVVPPYGWTLPFTIHTGMAVIVTAFRAIRESPLRCNRGGHLLRRRELAVGANPPFTPP